MLARVFRKVALPLVGVLCAALASGATIVVNDESGTYHGAGCGTTGTGLCTLVDAIVFANGHTGSDAIHFNIPGGGTRTIVPSGPLPALTDDAGVTIDGFTQPGASPNALSAGNNAIWRVVLSGGSVTVQSAGILVQSDNNVVRGLLIQGWVSGVEISGAANNRISGNFLGGETATSPSNGDGVLLRSGAQSNQIGGTLPGERNLFNGNSYGIRLTDAGTAMNAIQGNFVGRVSPGSTTPRNYLGILLTDATSNRIGGSASGAGNVISGNETDGVILNGTASDNRIEGNRIGTTPDGSSVAGNAQTGVLLFAGPHDNVVGGQMPGSGNLISGNGAEGVGLQGFGTTGNHVEGNLIGTDLDGSLALSNGSGVGTSLGAENNVIGGTSAAARNVISGNQTHGVILGVSGGHNLVLGNFIGTDRTGTSALPNGTRQSGEGGGILIHASSGNRIGGLLPGEQNVIAYNGNSLTGGFGVAVYPADTEAGDDGNAVLSNSIHDNVGLGVDLGIPSGVTPNDDDDGDSGPNGFQNFPVIENASFSPGSVTVTGTLNSKPSTSYTVQFFASHRCDDSGHGEGEFLLGGGAVSTDLSGNASFQLTLPVSAAAARRVSANATDPDGNTSEFSECFPRATSFYTLTPCRVADTRDPPGPSGGPALAAGGERIFPVAGQCGIPITAQAVSFNVTVVGPTQVGHFVVYPPGTRLPLASTLNFGAGQTRANNAVIPLGTGGSIAIVCGQSAGGAAHAVIDVNGYFE